MKSKDQIFPGRHALGMTLLEVIVGIAIFAIGMLALTQLQGALARSAGDAATRTVAINIAEEVIERQRGFSRVTKDPYGIEPAYLDIESLQYSVTRAGVGYAVNVQVTDYWYDRSSQLFTTTKPLVAAVSDFKLLRVGVSAGDGPEFIIDAKNTTQGRLGSDGVLLSEIISSITSAADAKSATGGTGGLHLPSVDYNPGSNPDFIPISLGDNKFRESAAPLPKVIRADDLAETTFDVVTYSQDAQGATFLRREEFRAVSCNCELRVPGTGAEGGLRPTVWDGNDYSRGEFVSKTYGISTSNVQSNLCGLCCRDHHDGGSGADDEPGDAGRSRFDPFRASGEYWDAGSMAGDHRHYFRDKDGGLTLASAGGSAYMEACRMVRRNGFWQVGQDLRQEGLNLFPEGYLDTSSAIGAYSAYVTGAVEGYEVAINGVDGYELLPPTLALPSESSPALVIPASTESNPTKLPTSLGSTSQQLRARGIYLDYMTDTLRTIVDCLQLGGSGASCGAPHVTTPLEIIPFYDVQLTWLTRWNETPFNNPVDVSNQAISTNNAHSRGLAQLTLGTSLSTVDGRIHKGNLGLTGTDPIDLDYAADLRAQFLYVDAVQGTPPPAVNEYLIEGLITSNIKSIKASDVELSASGAQCNRTNTGYKCLVEVAADNPRIKFTNYYKQNDTRVVCSAVLTLDGSLAGADGWTRFNLPGVETLGADIIVTRDSC